MYKTARRVVIFVIGITVVLIGMIMVITPGPAIIVIPAGLAILATEFVWAARLLRRMKQGANSAMNSMRTRPKPDAPDQSHASGQGTVKSGPDSR